MATKKKSKGKPDWKCPDCKTSLDEPYGFVARCLDCKRAYIVITDEERAVADKARKKKNK